jgi:hypothetical protein
MGVINFGINRPLVENLAKTFHIQNFVETGTYLGGTTSWAATIFKQVYTIEISEELYRETSEKYKDLTNIHFYLGDSKEVMPSITSIIEGSTLFWLDGHWCGRNTGGKFNECPIMDELTQAVSLKDPVILIDDLRCFLGPNPHDHGENYPSIHVILQFLTQHLPNNFITFHDDTLICAPLSHKAIIDKDWSENYSKRYPIKIKSVLSKIVWRIKHLDFTPESKRK